MSERSAMTVHLVFERANRPGTYWPTLNGERLTKGTRSPLYDGARALLALGVDPGSPLTASHAGSTTVSLQSTVGEASLWSVCERDRGGLQRIPYRQFNPHSEAPE
jgi:hypothetical protein